MEKQSTFFHVNKPIEMQVVDIGHSIDSVWDVSNNYPYYSLNFVLDGATILEIDGQGFEIAPYQLFLLPPNTPVHYFSAPKSKRIEVYWLNFYGNQCRELMQLTDFAKSPVCSIPKKLCNHLEKNFQETITLCAYPHLQSTACTHLLTYIIKTLLLMGNSYQTVSTKTKMTNFDNILSLINANLFSNKLDAKLICDLCYITPEYLSRTFKKNMGLHFASYVNTERIKKASTLLSETNLSVREISETVGYGDVYYFCKIFKKYRLMTPTQWRNKPEN